MDTMVAQMVAWAHLVETALHDDGPWSFQTLGGDTPAHRVIDHSRNEIVFAGITKGTGTGQVELWCRDRFVTSIWTHYPLSPGDSLTWTLSLSPVVRT